MCHLVCDFVMYRGCIIAYCTGYIMRIRYYDSRKYFCVQSSSRILVLGIKTETVPAELQCRLYCSVCLLTIRFATDRAGWPAGRPVRAWAVGCIRVRFHQSDTVVSSRRVPISIPHVEPALGRRPLQEVLTNYSRRRKEDDPRVEVNSVGA